MILSFLTLFLNVPCILRFSNTLLSHLRSSDHGNAFIWNTPSPVSASWKPYSSSLQAGCYHQCGTTTIFPFLDSTDYFRQSSHWVHFTLPLVIIKLVYLLQLYLGALWTGLGHIHFGSSCVRPSMKQTLGVCSNASTKPQYKTRFKKKVTPEHVKKEHCDCSTFRSSQVVLSC